MRVERNEIPIYHPLSDFKKITAFPNLPGHELIHFCEINECKVFCLETTHKLV